MGVEGGILIWKSKVPSKKAKQLPVFMWILRLKLCHQEDLLPVADVHTSW